MMDFAVISESRACFNIDLCVYEEKIITKVLYWLSAEYTIETSKEQNCYKVILESTRSVNWAQEKQRISQQFVDYQMRSIIQEETRDIRNILYIKAFANLDDFEEYDTEEEI